MTDTDTDPRLLDLQTQLWELRNRLEDLTIVVHNLTEQSQP
jgi:hypothetical protein